MSNKISQARRLKNQEITDKLVNYLKKCPACNEGQLQIVVDALVYFNIDSDERIDDSLLDERNLVCSECGSSSEEDQMIKERFKLIDEVF